MHAGGESKTYHYRQPNGSTAGVSEPYNVQIQIPADAEAGGFSIIMTYVNCYYGDKAVRIYGALSAAQPPDPIGSTRGGKDDNSKTVHDGGDGPAEVQ